MPHWQSLIQMKQAPASAWMKAGIMRRGDAVEEQRISHEQINGSLLCLMALRSNHLMCYQQQSPTTTTIIITSYFSALVCPPSSNTVHHPAAWKWSLLWPLFCIKTVLFPSVWQLRGGCFPPPPHWEMGELLLAHCVDANKFPGAFLQLGISHMLQLQHRCKSRELLVWLRGRY